MKIRPSLRLYFLIALFVTGAATILSMSAVSLNYFFSGLDFAMTGSMHSQAFQEKVSDGKPVQIQNFTVATRWQDLPQLIQDNLDQKELVTGELLKEVKGIPIIAPPEAGYFVMRFVKGEKTRYVSALFSHDGLKGFTPDKKPPFFLIALTALFAIVLFLLVLIIIMRKVATPIEMLRDWAKELDKDKLSQPTPDFHYSELNSLATIIQSSLKSVQEGLEREQRFLGYASHELRTPIAVSRTNSELLRKMITREMDKDKLINVLERIERAGYTMTDLTETLLWLNRQEDKSLPLKAVSIGALCLQLNQELAYLLNGKKVEVTIDTDENLSTLPEPLCRIVITNLIRNAFQHTYEGEVSIKQSNASLTIINNNHSGLVDNEELGFGLGLELTERLIYQYGWKYNNIKTKQGHQVDLQF